MKELHKILIPVPISEDGIKALNQAELFRKTLNLDITILHVIPESSKLVKLSKNELSEKEKEAKTELSKFICDFYDSEIPEHVHIRLLQGDLVDTIVKYSKEKDSDLIIIKKAKRKANKYGLFNQNDADKIIARSSCPVITLNDDWNKDGIKNILLPVDIIQKTDKKVNWALFLAKKFNAKVTVVSALTVPISKDTSLAYKKAESIKDYFLSNQVECEFEIVDAYDKKPHRAILEYADKINPDLMMVMTKKENLSFDKTIGTCATEVIHEANYPIFTFIPESDTVFKYLIRIMDSGGK